MAPKLILFPLLAQIGLTLWVYVHLAIAKRRALALDQVDHSRRALHADAWPDSVLQISNNLRNQFEAPVLFYVLVLVIWAIGAVNLFSMAVAWGFVLSRCVHAHEHLRRNYVPRRRAIFMVGWGLLVVLLLQCLWSLSVS